MDLYLSTNNRRRASRQDQTLNAVVDFRYLAPAKLARDEVRERMLAEAALRQFVDGNDPKTGRLPLMEMVRHRLGGILILIGMGLQGAHADTTTVPTAVGPGSAGQ
jgi:hypothetical protein